MKKLLVMLSLLLFSYHVQFLYAVNTLIDRRGVYKIRTNIVSDPTTNDDTIISVAASHVTVDLEGYCVTQDADNGFAGLSGITVESNVQDVTIRNGSILNITGTGIYIHDGCSEIKLENIVIQDSDSGGIFFDGLSTGTGIKNVTVNNCLVTSCTGSTGGDAQGLVMHNTQAFTVTRSAFLQNDASAVTSSFGVKLISCNNGKLFECQSHDNAGDMQGVGFLAFGSSNLIFDSCSALHNLARGSNTGSTGAGFVIDTSNHIIFKQCQANENQATEQTARGFFANNGAANIIQDCVSQVNSGGALAAGFELRMQTNSCITRCISKNNQTTTSGTAYGILLAASGNNNCYVSHNTLIANLGASASRGIEDERTSSTSYFRQNDAFNNGTNYMINYPSTIELPTIVGSLSDDLVGLPALTSGDLDNLDVSP